MKNTTCQSLYSYVVAHDSGFAPNPFRNFCTLATCKPPIRRDASLGDWVVGTGSANKRKVDRGGFFVYAMRVCEILCFKQYWNDPRFKKKKPHLCGSYLMACGDNIYYPLGDGKWGQLDSYHSNTDGSPHQKHIERDTKINRVLISDDFIYFGGEGPKIPDSLKRLVKQGRGYRKLKYQNMEHRSIIMKFETWFKGLRAEGYKGYQGRPFDMIKETKKEKRK